MPVVHKIEGVQVYYACNGCKSKDMLYYGESTGKGTAYICQDCGHVSVNPDFEYAGAGCYVPAQAKIGDDLWLGHYDLAALITLRDFQRN